MMQKKVKASLFKRQKDVKDVNASPVVSTPPPSPTHPGRVLKRCPLVEDEEKDVIMADDFRRLAEEFDSLVQYVDTKLVADRHN